ncbi:DNA-binding protein RFX2 isoform X2 [Rhineura floridana]|uniref:DNA-binding protein RFX2 isoform X2 n=1 Tax=Rhineura floridana TaxID=261503 RepID=UPI002AC86637|nr:DNA-binding protein RFX2 isoform X2 [Rhineura floridana]
MATQVAVVNSSLAASVQYPIQQAYSVSLHDVSVATLPSVENHLPKPAGKNESSTAEMFRSKAPPPIGLWATKCDGEVKLRMDESGIGCEPPITVHQLFLDAVRQYGDFPALASKKNGKWTKMTFKEYYEECRAAAKSFIQLGLQRFHGVCILGFNSAEWFISDIGAILAGGFAVGIYTTNSPDACQYVADNCGANFIVVENDKQLQKILEVKDKLPLVKAIIQYGEELKEKRPNLYTWSEFMALGSSVSDDQLDKIIESQKPNQCCTLIYTSGTTGQPKGTMLSHDNITWTARAGGEYVSISRATERQEVVVSYLPLSHVAAQMIDIWLPITFGVQTCFAQPDALKGTLVNTLKEVHPTAFLGVPRVWEKMQEKMKSVGAKSSALKRRIAVWAKAVGLETNLKRINGSTDLPLNYRLAKTLVYKKVRKALGLDHCTKCYTGAAPITKDTLEYFLSLDIPVYELYGMSESSGPHTASHSSSYRLTSCGKEITGCKSMLFRPDNEGVGEICFSGRHIFMGYLNMEDKTKEAIDDDGWLHSGDLGKHDTDGFLYITGRIKELIITAGGENIPPVPIEDAIKEAIPILSNVMLVGDKAKFLIMLMTLKCKVNLDTGEPEDALTPEVIDFCRKLGSKATKVSDIVSTRDPAVYTAIQKGVSSVNDQATSNAQKIQKWVLLDKDFSISGGELEPGMQASEGGSDSATPVALRSSASVQAPVVQPVPASQQVPTVQHVYPAQVQYVEAGEAVYTNGTIRAAYSYNTEAQIYTPSSASSYFEAQGGGGGGGSAQVSTGPSSPTAIPSHGMVGIAMDLGGSQIVSSSGAYLIHGGMESARHALSHSSRSSPATLEMAIENLQKAEGISSHKSSLLNSHLQWLLDNYETAEGVSLPRSSLYSHYLCHCQEHKLDPVNAASFGKLIRSVFMGLRTRRLGTRGNSKYHYYGIRLKPDSPLNRLQEDAQFMAMRQQPVHQKQRYRPSQKMEGMAEGGSNSSLHTTPEQSVAAQSQHHQQFIDVTRGLAEFPSLDLENHLLQEGIDVNDLKALQVFYRQHCEANVEVVMTLQFPYIEKLWQSFWNSEPHASEASAALPSSEEPCEALIPRHKLVAMCKYDPIMKWMRSCDHVLYQTLVEILIPDVLRPVPSTLTQAIRNFAKSLEGWLINAMSEFPQQIVQTKVGVVSAFAQTLRRYTSLNHLAQAARAVLQNTSQINQMLSDLNRVDFTNVQEQASWVCQCEEGLVQKLEQDFKLTLQRQSSLDQWASWLDNVVTHVLKHHEGGADFPKAARQFLLKWSFYSSMVIRDLTLRSAASFGSFHLIRLLYDEYMFYLVEHRVAQATGETPIAVMGEFSDLASMSPALLDKDDISDLGSEAEGDSRCSGEPLVKRERNDPAPSLQEI